MSNAILGILPVLTAVVGYWGGRLDERARRS